MINKASLIRAVNKTTGITLREASICIDSIIESLNDAISRGERIELRGLGTFFVKKVTSRKTGIGFIPAHSRIYFKPCQKLRESVWNIKKTKNESVARLAEQLNNNE